MAVAEELKVIIKAEVDKATRDLKRFQGELGKAGKEAKSAGGSFQSMGKNVAGMLAKAAGITALVALMAKLAKGSLAAAAAFEVQQVELGVFLGDIEKGTALFRQLQEFSSRTPLQLETITNAAKVLMSFGTDAADVQMQIQMLGDAALGNAQKLETLTRAFGKVQARGRASMEEVNQAMEAGLPIIDELAKQMGVAKSEVFDLISAGKIGFEEWNEAFKTMTGESGQFFEGMEKLSQTLTGKLSTLKDNLKLLGAAMQKDVLPLFKDALDFGTRIIQDLTVLIENDAIGEMIRIVGEGLWAAMNAIFAPEQFERIANVIGQSMLAIFSAAFQSIGAMFGSMSDIIVNTAANLGDDWATELLNGMIRGLTRGPRAILALLGLEGARDWQPFETTGPRIGEALGQAIIGEFPDILEAYKTHFRNLAGAAQEIGVAIGDAIEDPISAMNDRMTALLERLRAKAAEIREASAPVGGGGGDSRGVVIDPASALTTVELQFGSVFIASNILLESIKENGEALRGMGVQAERGMTQAEEAVDELTDFIIENQEFRAERIRRAQFEQIVGWGAVYDFQKARMHEQIRLAQELAAEQRKALGVFSDLGTSFASAISGGDQSGLVRSLATMVADAIIPGIGQAVGVAFDVLTALWDFAFTEFRQGVSDAADEAQDFIDDLDLTYSSEIELRNKYLRELKEQFNLEFDVLRDLWDRGLITTEDFISGMEDISDEVATATEGAEERAAVEAATGEIDSLTDAISAIQEEIADLFAEWDDLTWLEKLFTNADEKLAAEIELLEAELAGLADALSDAEDALSDASLNTQDIAPASGGSVSRGGVNRFDSVVVNINGDILGVDDLGVRIEDAIVAGIDAGMVTRLGLIA